MPANFTGVAVVNHWRQGGGSGNYGMQILYGLNNSRIFFRQSSQGGTWTGSWQEIPYNLPSFYKDYVNLSGLAAALGVIPVNVSAYNSYTTEGVYEQGGDIIEVISKNGYTIQRVTCINSDRSLYVVFIRALFNGVWGTAKRLDLI